MKFSGHSNGDYIGPLSLSIYEFFRVPRLHSLSPLHEIQLESGTSDVGGSYNYPVEIIVLNWN